MEFGVYYKSLRESLDSGDRRANRIYAEGERYFIRTLTSGYRGGWCPAEREIWERIAFLLLDSGMIQMDIQRFTAVATRSVSPDHIKNVAGTTYRYVLSVKKTNIWTGFGMINTAKFGIGRSYTVVDMVNFIRDLFVYMVAVSYVFDIPVSVSKLGDVEFRNWVAYVALDLSTSEKQFIEYVNAFEKVDGEGLPPKYDIGDDKDLITGQVVDKAKAIISSLASAPLEDGAVQELSLRDLSQMKNINDWTEEEFGAELTSLYLAMAVKQNHKGMLDVLNIKAKIMGLFKETDVGGNTFNTLVLLQSQTESALESMGYVKRRNEN